MERHTGQMRAGVVLAQRYRVLRLLARGGMGAVYLAEDTRLDNAPVALKEMLATARPGDTDSCTQAVAEFHREAALLARLSHPNLPRVFDRFAQDGKQFLAMEYVEGRTLRQVLNERAGPLPLDEVLSWVRQLAAVLGYLHAQQPPIIYRDLKPGNVMLRPDGRLVLVDFGIARFYKPGQSSDTAIYGTPGYAAPEQYGEGQTDARSDIYALGVLIHHALTGHDPASTPFRLPSLHQLRPDLPIALANLVARATQLEPARRFASMADLLAALPTPTLPAPPVPTAPAARRQPGRPWLLGLGVGLAVLLGLSILPFVRGSEVAPLGRPAQPTPTALPAPPDMLLVEAGPFTIGSQDDPAAAPAHLLNLPAFLIDRTEVTNRAYRACVAAKHCQPPAQSGPAGQPDYYDNPAFDNYPVVYVSWYDARGYCAAQGRRLPSEAEWEKAARGSDQRIYPWGSSWQAEQVHLSGDSLGDRLAPVGSIPANASPYGALDMAGNVWEWTSSRSLPYPYASGDGREVASTAGPRVLRGGAWGDSPRNASTTIREAKPPEEVFWNRGFRCAASVALPARDGAGQATDLPSAPADMVAVPGGLLAMGTSPATGQRWVEQYGWDLPVAEFPQHSVTVGPFLLDRTEVTNGQYAAFVAATGHVPPVNPFDPQGLSLWRDGQLPTELTDHPVVNVTWADAHAYCTWSDKRLPTEAEWEWAARGPAGRLLPWGDDFDSEQLNSADRRRGGPVMVGSYPRNVSWVGAFDLLGNVWEWTNSLSRPYPYQAFDGREDPLSSGPRAIRGGSWMDRFSEMRLSARNQFDPALANVNLGFRCAK